VHALLHLQRQHAGPRGARRSGRGADADCGYCGAQSHTVLHGARERCWWCYGIKGLCRAKTVSRVRVTVGHPKLL